MENLSFQLFSARNTPLSEALEIISASGYRYVEAYRDNVTDLNTFEAGLKTNNLQCTSIHIGIDELKNNLSHSLELAERLGIKQIVCPYLMPEQRPADTAGWKALAEELAGYAKLINAAGLPFAWHNHDFEFTATEDGALPIRILLDTATQMQWEIDLGWIQRASESPASWLRTYSDRISAVHLKDLAEEGDCLDEDGWADVGHGVLDWQQILPELKSIDVEHYVVEHDNPSDLTRFAQRSIATVQGWA
ncbi:hypothetical protein AB833_28090 [Chromatiales bacterium (ex Bugula neritina AB1)]|nr:hypothetical protein AB833_28090 [Chromatiales bacterium (ex Bugula neritina AB1)]